MEKNGNYEIVKSLDLGFLTMEVTYSVNQTGGLHKKNFRLPQSTLIIPSTIFIYNNYYELSFDQLLEYSSFMLNLLIQHEVCKQMWHKLDLE